MATFTQNISRWDTSATVGTLTVETDYDVVAPGESFGLYFTAKMNRLSVQDMVFQMVARNPDDSKIVAIASVNIGTIKSGASSGRMRLQFEFTEEMAAKMTGEIAIVETRVDAWRLGDTEDNYVSVGTDGYVALDGVYLYAKRYAPDISDHSFVDASYEFSSEGISAKDRFGAYVQGYSPLEFVSDITIDELIDKQLTLESVSVRVGDLVPVNAELERLVYEEVGYSYKARASIGAMVTSGEIPYTITATDSKGLVRTIEGTITVLPYTPPRLDAFAVQRYSEYVLEDGSTDYRASDDGERVWITVSGVVASVAGPNASNAWDATLVVKHGSEEERVVIFSAADGESFKATDDRLLYQKSVAVQDDYTFSLVLSDWFTSNLGTDITLRSFVAKGESQMHISGTGGGVAVGMYSTGNEYNKKFEVASDHTSHFYGPVQFYGGIVGGNLAYALGENAIGGTWIDGKPIYRYVFTTTVSSNGTITLGKLPSTPDAIVNTFGVLKQASGSINFLPNVYYGSTTWTVGYYVNENDEIILQSGSGYTGTRSIILIFEYTRAQDEAPVYFAVTNLLSNVTSDNPLETIAKGVSYSAQLTADSGYEITSVSITMAGADITSTAYADGRISIPTVTGDIIIVATATEKAGAEFVLNDDGSVTVSNVSFVDQGEGTVQLEEAVFTDLGDGTVQVE